MNVLLLSILTLGAPALKDKPTATSVVGDWVAENCIVGGKPTHFTDGQLRWSFTPDGARTIYKGGDRALTGKYSIVAREHPMHLDLDPAANPGASYLCIYKIDGDTMTLNVGWQGSPRPESFDSPAGSKCTLYIFKRAKPRD